MKKISHLFEKKYLKKRLLFVCLALLAGIFVEVNAQQQTMHATVSGGVTQNNVYAAVGQPFFQQLGSENGNLEFAYGIAQAQLVKDTVYDVVTYNEPYTGNSLNLPAQTQSYITSVYLVNGGPYRYDLLRTLYLIVCPESVADRLGNDIAYNTVGVSGHCWTKQNLRTPVSGAMTYNSTLHPASSIDVEKYGLLYSWLSALNASSVDNDGYVQGICPGSWHLPTEAEMVSLMSNPNTSLRSREEWMSTTYNDNSTGFSAYPAGEFSAAISRFQGYGTQTDWWTVANTTSVASVEIMPAPSLQIPYYCDYPIWINRNPNDAISVRCVMKNVWPE